MSLSPCNRTAVIFHAGSQCNRLLVNTRGACGWWAVVIHEHTMALDDRSLLCLTDFCSTSMGSLFIIFVSQSSFQNTTIGRQESAKHFDKIKNTYACVSTVGNTDLALHLKTENAETQQYRHQNMKCVSNLWCMRTL